MEGVETGNSLSVEVGERRSEEGVKEVVIFSDNDANFRGQSAAYKLANRLVEREGILATVEIPKEIGDYADLV